VAHPIVGRRRGDLEEEAQLAAALAEFAAMAAAKKRREEQETVVASVELFKQQEELEARTWAEGDSKVATGEGDAEAEVIIVDSD
jgi:mannose-6-phosphate isomerase class I